MMKLKKYTYILFISLATVFLFGCSGEHKQQSSADTSSKESFKQTAVKQTGQTEKVSDQGSSSQENSEAKQKLVFARNTLKMAQKGVLNYSQVAVLCRDVIKDYPDTEYQQQAQMLLREIPEDLRPQYNLTNEELGL